MTDRQRVGDATPSVANASNVSLKHETDEKLLKPLWIATKITHQPCAVCCVSFWLIIIMSVIDSFLFEWAPNDDRIYLIESDPYTEDYDAYVLASEAVSSDDDGDSAAKPQTESQSWWTVFMMFELDSYDTAIDTTNHPSTTDYWILTSENMKTIMKYEEKVTKSDKWTNNYCYVGSDTITWQCSYFSLAETIATNFNITKESQWDDITDNEIYNYVMNLYNNYYDYYGAIIESSFNSEFINTNQTYLYRSFITSANPIPTNNTYDADTGVGTKKSKYKNGEDDYDEQTDIYNEWAIDLWEDITVDHNAQLIDGNLRVVTLIFSAWIDYYYVLAEEAAFFITYAMCAVIVWMTYHLQSCWLSLCGMMGIMLSFPFAFFVYRVICQVTYFDTLATLIVFVLLGIGADDVFVFTDAWHQSVHFVKDASNAEERMTFAYRRASKAMLVTQITTFFAFLATAFSKLLPIKAFGIWAALIVACDYILVITLYPSVLMLYHKYVRKYEKKYLCCCCKYDPLCQIADQNDNQKSKNNISDGTDLELSPKPKKTNETNNNNDTAAGGDNNNNNNTTPNEARMEDYGDDDEGPPPSVVQRQKSVEEQALEYRRIEQIFGLKWTTMIIKLKYGLLIFFAIIFGLAVWQASLLEAVDESEDWFFEDHYMQSAIDLANDFTVSEEDGLIAVTVAWGIKGVDRSGTDYWDVEDYGSVIWDNTFDMSSYDAQLYLYNKCNELAISELAYQQSSVICPLNAFENYTLSIGEDFPYLYINDNDSSYDADIQKSLFAEMMFNFSESTYAAQLTANSLLYVKQSDDEGFEIKFIALLCYTDVSWDSAASETKGRRDDWDDWLDDEFTNNDECPDSVCKPIQASIMWAWLTAQDAFVTSAIQGIAIAMPIAFVVLIFSTHNWIVAIFATLNIVGIMACALAVMQLQGWQFGISESISIVIIIGFSVDYVVHFANAYLESKADTREERLSFALLTMGVSVVSGAITTLLAGLFLLFPSLVFFYKMGLIILITILASIMWALFFFTSLLAAFGPQYDTGNIPFDKLLEKCKKSNNNNDNNSNGDKNKNEKNNDDNNNNNNNNNNNDDNAGTTSYMD